MWFELSQDLWDYMAVSGAIYFTGAFAVLLCGLYWKSASKTGAYLALSAGVFALLGLKPIQGLVGVDTLFEKHSITGAHVGLTTMALAVILMVAGSLAFPQRQQVEGEQA